MIGPEVSEKNLKNEKMETILSRKPKYADITQLL